MSFFSKIIAIGKSADNAAVSDNPVLIAGQYSTTPATRHNGDAVTLETTATGALKTATQLTGTDEALATDLQGCNIPDNEPVPTKSVGSSTRKVATDSITLGTGATHAANDVISTDAGEMLEFDTGLSAGSSGIIYDSNLLLDQNAGFSGSLGYILYLWNVTRTGQQTNEAFDLASITGYVGAIEISSFTALSGSSTYVAKTDVGHNLSFNLAAADTKLYGQLVCKGTDITVTGKVLTVNLGVGAL